MGIKIKSLPDVERPREKAFRYGFSSLSDAEVLAIIISSGTKDISAIDLSNQVLSKYGGLYNTINRSFSDFITFKGIKTAIGAKLCAIFEIAKRYNSLRINKERKSKEVDSDYIYEMYVNSIVELDHEILLLVVLNKKKEIIFETVLFTGSLDTISFSIRDILKNVLSHNGVYFFVIHNHPSGNLNPSDEDIKFTYDLIFSANKVGVKLLDHLIIARSGYYSFFQKCVKEETYVK